MKKARFIGVLMAAVMAAVPFAGNAKTSFNSLKANADSFISKYEYINIKDGSIKLFSPSAHLRNFNNDYRLISSVHYGYSLTDPNSKGVAFRSSLDTGYYIDGQYIDGTRYIFNNDNYRLLFKDGYLQIIRRVYNKSTNKYTNTPTWSFYTGGSKLAFQVDGNMVTYSGDTPTAHTCTYDTSKTTKQGYHYSYILTNDGRFQIWRIPPHHIGKKEELIWDSSKNKMYKI